jgi:hypothetical protein
MKKQLKHTHKFYRVGHENDCTCKKRWFKLEPASRRREGMSCYDCAYCQSMHRGEVVYCTKLHMKVNETTAGNCDYFDARDEEEG